MSERLERFKQRIRAKKGDFDTVMVYRVKFVWSCPNCDSTNSYTYDPTTVVNCPSCDGVFRTQVIED